MNHLKDYTVEQIVTDLGLYQSVIIDTYEYTVEQIEEDGCDGSPPFAGEQYFTGEDVNVLLALQQSTHRFMLPCPKCKREQAFSLSSAPIRLFSDAHIPAHVYTYPFGSDDETDFQAHCKYKVLSVPHFVIEYTCPYDPYHKIYGEFVLEDVNDPEQPGNVYLKKAGQYPSMADMQFFECQKYKSVLKKHYRDYTMALGLFASGVGCGAFLYLRRILEHLAEDGHQMCRQQPLWNEQEYQQASFVDKIKLLETYGYILFPQEISDVKTQIYGLLSNGVHAGTEEECKRLFPYLRHSLEMIMNQRMADKENQQLVKQLEAEYQSVRNNSGGNANGNH